MLGPLLAFGLLQWGMTMEHVFMAAIIPGAALIFLLVFGLYHLLSGIMTLPGAVLFGAVWQWLGMSSAFAMAAILTTIAAIILRVLAFGTLKQKQ